MTKHDVFTDPKLQSGFFGKHKIMAILLILVALSAGIALTVVTVQKRTAFQAKITKEYATINATYLAEQTAFEKLKQEKKGTISEEDGNFETSMTQFYDFALKYPETPVGWQAALRCATYFIVKNQTDKTVKVLEAILPSSHSHAWIQVKARLALAGIYAQNKKISQAEEQFQRLSELKHNPAKNLVDLVHGQILTIADKPQQAKKLLINVLNDSTALLQNPDSYALKQSQLWSSYEK